MTCCHLHICRIFLNLFCQTTFNGLLISIQLCIGRERLSLLVLKLLSWFVFLITRCQSKGGSRSMEWGFAAGAVSAGCDTSPPLQMYDSRASPVALTQCGKDPPACGPWMTILLSLLFRNFPSESRRPGAIEVLCTPSNKFRRKLQAKQTSSLLQTHIAFRLIYNTTL